MYLRYRILNIIVLVSVLLSQILNVNAYPMGGSVGAAAAIVIEASTGEIIFAQNENKKLPMASTTKIMSALIALEQENIHEPFVVDSKAIMTEGSSMGLVEGDIVSLYTLAGGMLSASGNDAANAVAVKISGSIEKFAELMNTRAREMGLVSTNFKNPSGLPDDEHYTTAYELAKIAAYAMMNENFRKIASQQYIQLEYGNPPYNRTLRNHNRLLSMLDGTIGVKTGFTKVAGRCLVSAVERDGIMLVAVTLNAPDDWNIHKYLHNKAFDYVKNVKYPEMEEISAKIVSGETDTVKLALSKEQTSTIAIDGTQTKLEKTIYLEPFYYAPIKKGQILGRVEYLRNGIIIDKIELVAMNDVASVEADKESFMDRILGYFA